MTQATNKSCSRRVFVRYLSSFVDKDGTPSKSPGVMAVPFWRPKFGPDPPVAKILQEFNSIELEFRRRKRNGQQPSFHGQVHDILDGALKPGSKEEVKNIVGIALGNPDNGDNDYRHQSIEQHVLLQTIKDFLGPIPIYSQDPAHGKNSKTALGMKDIEVLDDPEGILQIDEGTCLVSICGDIPIKEIVADLARPAILIWIKLDRCGPPYYPLS